MRLIDRLFEYLHHHRLTPYTFERECGVANGYLQKQKKGKGSIGSDILEKIHAKYNDLNVFWLVTGKGRMLTDSPYNSSSISANLLESPGEYQSSEQAIKQLNEKIELLEKALADKEKIIKLLEASR
jgi:hypothetical protein